MSRLPDILAGNIAPGVYRFTSHAAPQRVRREAEKAGWRCFVLDGRQIEDKATFLRHAARSLDFPDGYGHNWDAFEEAVRDLNWARPRAIEGETQTGFVVLYDDVSRFAKARPDDWNTAREILEGAVEAWRAHGVPMIVLLRGANRAAGDLQTL